MTDSSSRPPRRETVLWTTVLVLGCALLAAGDPPIWWVGAALVAMAGTVWWPHIPGLLERCWAVPLMVGLRAHTAWAWGGPRRRAVWRELMVLSLFVVAAAWILGESDVLSRIHQNDHPAQFARSWYTTDALLSEGRLCGWNNEWFAGTPHNLYPAGGGLWVTLWHCLTLGALDYSDTYGLAIFAFFAFQAYAVYRLGRSCGSPLAGIIAGLLVMADPGAGRSGGFVWAMQVGVWPNSLAIAFLVLALSHARSVIDTRSRSAVAWFALWAALSLITHPLALLFLGLTGVTAAIFILVRPMLPTREALKRLALSLGLPLLLAGFWWVRFLGSKEMMSTATNGIWWDTAQELGNELWSQRFVDGVPEPILLASLIGSVMCIIGPHRLTKIVVVLGALTLLTFNASVVDELHLALVADAFGKVQWLRASVLLRAIVYFAAAYAAARAVVWGYRALAPRRLDTTAPFLPLARRRALPWVLAATTLASPVAAGFVGGALSDVRQRRLKSADDIANKADRAALVEYLATLPAEPVGGFSRIGYDAGGRTLGYFALASQFDRPTFKMEGNAPTVLFKHAFSARDVRTLMLLRVRYVVTDKPAKRDPEGYRQIARFGALRVLVATSFPEQPVDVLDAAATVNVTEFGSQRIALSLSGVSPNGPHPRVRLPIAFDDHWRVTAGGRDITTQVQVLRRRKGSGVLTFPAEDGDYVVEYRSSTAEDVADTVSLFAWLALLGSFVFFKGQNAPRPEPTGPRPRPASDESAEGEPAEAVAWLVGAGVALAVLVLGLSTFVWSVPKEERGGWRVAYDFVEALPSATVSSAGEPCAFYLGRHRCGPQPMNHVASTPSRLIDRAMHRCVSTRPNGKGPVVITYEDVPLGGRLRGYFGVPARGKKSARKVTPVTLDIYVGSTRAFSRTVKRGPRIHNLDLDLTKYPHTQTVRFEITAPRRAKRSFCVALQSLRAAP